MKDAKQLFLSVAKEVLEMTKDGDIPAQYTATCGVDIGMHLGICNIMGLCEIYTTGSSGHLTKRLYTTFRAWPKFSGSSSYPVPGVFASRATAFECATHEDMWSPSHPYGALRRELLEFLIQEMEKEDEDETKWIIET